MGFESIRPTGQINVDEKDVPPPRIFNPGSLGAENRTRRANRGVIPVRFPTGDESLTPSRRANSALGLFFGERIPKDYRSLDALADIVRDVGHKLGLDAVLDEGWDSYESCGRAFSFMNSKDDEDSSDADGDEGIFDSSQDWWNRKKMVMRINSMWYLSPLIQLAIAMSSILELNAVSRYARKRWIQLVSESIQSGKVASGIKPLSENLLQNQLVENPVARSPGPGYRTYDEVKKLLIQGLDKARTFAGAKNVPIIPTSRLDLQLKAAVHEYHGDTAIGFWDAKMLRKKKYFGLRGQIELIQAFLIRESDSLNSKQRSIVYSLLLAALFETLKDIPKEHAKINANEYREAA